ncbi:MAG: YerC/YecD family TrpR-related protein [bacterium]|nr:YerC/YecD family TrpR-related protein [bacterium]
MAQVSKYPISKAVEARVFEILFKVISDLKNPQEIQEFFQDFLSPVEQLMLAKRLSIAVLLSKGYDYASIRKVLRVSPPTISKTSLALKYAGKGYKRIVEKLTREEKIDEFLQKVEDVVLDQLPPGGGNWSYWRKNREIKKIKRRKAF